MCERIQSGIKLIKCSHFRAFKQEFTNLNISMILFNPQDTDAEVKDTVTFREKHVRKVLSKIIDNKQKNK